MFCVWKKFYGGRAYQTACGNTHRGNLPKSVYCPYCWDYSQANGMGTNPKKIRLYRSKYWVCYYGKRFLKNRKEKRI